jgi:hypothetical protein
MRRAGAFPVLLLAGLLTLPRASTADIPVEGLLLFHGYDEASGDRALDLTGNGHEGALQGGTGWGEGCLLMDGGSATMMTVADAPDLHYDSFTWDIWVTADGINYANRILTQAERVGGTGPEIFAYGRLAVRINNEGAVFDPPTVGSRTNDGPPDHLGLTEDNLPTGGDAPLHIVMVHDGPSRMVRIFFGRESQDLVMQFEASYAGTFDVSSSGLTMGNVRPGERGFEGSFFQLAVYGRALTWETDGSRLVSGGEILDTHLEGPDAYFCIPADEVCNGEDDDCDGTADNGAVCPGDGEVCVDGVCVAPVEEGPDALEAPDAPADVQPEAPDAADTSLEADLEAPCVWDDDCPDGQSCRGGQCLPDGPGDTSGGCSCRTAL